ncbi:MAG: hypothetical protein M0C28_17715 [Candidatus Moduliflexus flocculans]|nr:hypothetical protein [Candidatus Moduliflexus flocculans]
MVILGIVAEAAHVTTRRMLKAEREQELLFRGNAYRRAIQSYYEAGGAIKQFRVFARRPAERFAQRRESAPSASRRFTRTQWSRTKSRSRTRIRAADGGIGGGCQPEQGRAAQAGQLSQGAGKARRRQVVFRLGFRVSAPGRTVLGQRQPAKPTPASPPVLKSTSDRLRQPGPITPILGVRARTSATPPPRYPLRLPDHALQGRGWGSRGQGAVSYA